jgi:proteasome lid subunit RPN8/RPN11
MKQCHISRSWIEAVRKHGEETFPEECCGVLVGHTDRERGRTVVARALPADNVREDAARHNRFLIEPRRILQIQKEARSDELEIVGYYHSHPDHPAVPSDFDREHAWPDQSYVIVSVREGRAGDQRSWRLADDRSRFLEERLIVT